MCLRRDTKGMGASAKHLERRQHLYSRLSGGTRTVWRVTVDRVLVLLPVASRCLKTVVRIRHRGMASLEKGRTSGPTEQMVVLSNVVVIMGRRPMEFREYRREREASMSLGLP